ncbi:MAG TPA: ATP-dependent 6-phosphofructokinase [Mycobacterium sp.]|uniref:ATP-dependent 6-phosphofructokinase n=1 Tax=Mycolicibacterium sp. TaxID=2320850 RepID=UPI0025F9027F|nr:ATP-dependent 6-phosphofructokinase [Mycolicibacterium sp.]HPX35167.1 ATP-dependent 6-phosphofructokinase [Mycobacterium sp.]HQC75581.1 ATP-dependent 6-phosphofructokinase [Mycobacterium sp.]
MRIGVLTGGGDCPGLNAVIRAVVRTCDARYGSSVVGFQDGWNGLLENRRIQLVNDDRNARLLAKGGTMLGTARTNPERLRAGIGEIKQTLEDNGIDVLIPIGGEGTLTAAHWLTEEGVPVVGVPKTIDNDIDCTDVTFGHDTALMIATEAIDRLHSTAESHQRVMLVEVMGRHAGWIALNAGLASGAHMTLIPEQPYDVEEVCRMVKQHFQRGASHFILVVAEGAKPAEGTMALRSGGVDEFGHERFTGVAQQLALEVEKRIRKEVRVTVLGHIQRGGTPTAYDRVLATRFGVNAADAAHAGEYGMMVSLRGEHIGRVPLADAVRQLKLVPQSRYDDAAAFFG